MDADGLFYYVYGFLHSAEWRKQWEITLRKEAARIELPGSLEEFQRISEAGKQLADWHLHYESVEPLAELDLEPADGFDQNNPAHYEVDNMKWGGKRPNVDKSVLHFNRYLTFRNIPLEVHNYRLGARSALEWMVDRYKVKTDKRSQIRKNPNSYRGGQYLFNLLPRIAALSLKTLKITNQRGRLK